MAVAAIPISLVMGTVGVGGFYFTKAKIAVFMERMNTVVAVVESTPDETVEVFATLRAGCTEEFAEKAGTIRHGARALASVYQATVPWCSVLVRKAFGVAGAARSAR